MACVAAAGLVGSAPSNADPPQCDSGPIVLTDCPSGGLCTGVINNQCVGPIQPPLLPPPPDVRVGIRGGVGVGIG
ncbi:MAG: hypothetical protein QOJ20_5971 [Mycobacterium sp.]|jgi:hypothetical protein|nr:hypothetical protein [Mycobacterium sp.]